MSLTAAEFKMLSDTHTKVDALAEAFARHVGVEETFTAELVRQRASRAPVASAVAAWCAFVLTLVTVLLR